MVLRPTEIENVGKQRNSVTLGPTTRTIGGRGLECKAYKEGLELAYGF